MKLFCKVVSFLFLVIFIMLTLIALDLCLLEDYLRASFFFVGSMISFFMMAINGYFGVNIE